MHTFDSHPHFSKKRPRNEFQTYFRTLNKELTIIETYSISIPQGLPWGAKVETMKGAVRMRFIKGLLFTGIAALLVGYGINRTAFIEKFPFLEQNVTSDVAEKIQVLTSPDGVDLLTAPFTRPEEIDYVLVENRIMTLLNDLRLEQGLLPLTKNETLKAAADYRAIETQTSFSHTRPDGTDFYTVILTDEFWYPYQTVGENLAMATYFKDEVGMAEFLFNGWVKSEGHYANMIQPDFLEVGIGVHYDGEFLYAVQLFGKQSQ